MLITLFIINYCLKLISAQSLGSWNCSSMLKWPKYQTTSTSTGNDKFPYMTKIFQKWLHAYQSDCTREICEIGCNHRAGIGSTLNVAILNFGKCLSDGKIYAPSDVWLWAGNLTRCPSQSLDCYFEKHTKCHENMSSPLKSNFSPTARSKGQMNNSYIKEFQPIDTSPCMLAKEANMSTIWVFGQLYLYLTRMDPIMKKAVETRIQEIHRSLEKFPHLRRNENTSKLTRPLTYISAHIRRGSFFDGRYPISMNTYYETIEYMSSMYQASSTSTNDSLSRSSRNNINHNSNNNNSNNSSDSAGTKQGYSGLDYVYLSGDNINKNVDIENVNNEMVRRGVAYRFIAPQTMSLDPKREVEHLVRGSAHAHLKEALVTEYLVDMYMYAHSNVAFIGVTSNVFLIIKAYREALGLSNTCMFDISKKPSKTTTSTALATYKCDVCDPGMWSVPYVGLSCDSR